MIPIIAAAAKAVASNVVKGAIVKGVTKEAVKGVAKNAVKGVAKNAVKGVAKNAVKGVATNKHKLGMELMGDNEANVYTGKKSVVDSKLKQISDNFKNKAKDAIKPENLKTKAKEMLESDGSQKKWSERIPVAQAGSVSTDNSVYDEQINKLKKYNNV